MEHADIFTSNNKGKVVVKQNSIPNSNFKLVFKSMVSDQQNLNWMGINEFFNALKRLSFKTKW